MLAPKAQTAAVSPAAHPSSTTLASSPCTGASPTTVAAGGSSDSESASSSALLMPPAPVGSRAFSTPGTGSFAILARSSSAASISTAGSVTSTAAGALMQSQRALLLRKNLPLVLSSLPELVSVQSLRQTALSSLQAAADAFDTFLESNAGILLDQSSCGARTAGTHTVTDSTVTSRPTLVKSASLTHCRAAAAEAAAAAASFSAINVPASVRSPPLGASPSPQSASSSCSLATPVARTPTALLVGGPPPFRMPSRKPSLNSRRAQHVANAAAAAAAGASAKHGLPPLSRVLSPVTPPQYSPPVVSPPVVSPPVHSPPSAGGIPTHSPPLRSANSRHPAVPHVTVTSPTGSVGSSSGSPCVAGGAIAASGSYLHNLPPLATSPAVHSHNGSGSGNNSACSSTSHSRGLSMPVFDRATVAALGALSGHSNPASPRPPSYSPAGYARTPYVIGEAQLQAMLAQNEQNRAIMLHAEAYRLQAPHAAESSLKLGLNISVGGNSPHSNGQTPCGRTSALASPTLSETGSTTSRASVSSTRSLVRSPGSSPPPVEKPAWALRLASKPLITFSDDDAPLSVPRPGSVSSMDSSRSSQNGHSRFGGGGLNMSLSIPCDMILDRAQSYVVREHTVVVGAYRINQNGLFAAGNGLPSATSSAALESPDDHDEEDEEEEEQDEQDEEVSNDSGYDDDDTACADEHAHAHANHAEHARAADDAESRLSPASAAAAAASLSVINDNEGSRYADAHVDANPAETQAAHGSKRSFADRAAKIARSRARHGTMPASLSSQHQPRLGVGFGGGRASVPQLVSSGSSRSPAQPQAMCLSKEDLVELEIIGRGQNGNVRKAVHLPTLTRVALKSMDIYEKGTRHQLLHELHAFSGLNSPHLISFLGAYHDSGRIFLATEYMDCGSLSHFAHRLGGAGRGGPGRISDERILKHISAQILEGLKYLHENHRVHRDIKPVSF